MNPKIKGLALSAAFSMIGFVVWNLIVGVQPNPLGVVIIGGGMGLITGFIASVVRGGQTPIVVGTITAVAIWWAFAALAISWFGTSGFDMFKFLSGTAVFASMGGFIGYGYKLGAR